MCGSSYQPMMMSGPLPRLAARAALGRTSSQVMYSTLTGTPVASVNFFELTFHSSSSDLTNPDQRNSRSDASFSGLKTGSLLAPCARALPAASPTPHSSTVRREILGMRSPGNSRRRIIALRDEFAKRARSCGDGRHSPMRLKQVLFVVLMLGACTRSPPGACVHGNGILAPLTPGPRAIKTVFVIVMENKDWSDVQGSASAPYLNSTLLPAA